MILADSDSFSPSNLISLGSLIIASIAIFVATKASRRLENEEHPRIAFESVRYENKIDDLVMFQFVVSNSSKLPDAIKKIAIHVQGYTPQRKQAGEMLVLNLPGTEIKGDWVARVKWPHELPVNVGPLSVLTFKICYRIDGLFANKFYPPLDGSITIKVQIETLRGQMLEKMAIREDIA